jgi:SAM-dependent methyltransferase
VSSAGGLVSIDPDLKDWTWVLAEPCPECGFDAPRLDLGRLPQAIRDNATLWEIVLETDDAAVRPQANVWSGLEYACHVRDVHELFARRLEQMLTEDDTQFASWDQDAAAVEHDYGSQSPAEVAAELLAAAERVATAYENVSGEQWSRRGTRSNGDVFTVDTFARYHLHDVVHHSHDVSHITKRVTVESYQAQAQEYAEATRQLPDTIGAAMDGFAAVLGEGARVLEIGSGPGRDAAQLEERRLRVRRTDITPAFVRMLKQQGHEADVLDPLHDDLSDPAGPYDGVWASASLLHVRREDLPAVLANLAAVTRPAGRLFLALKEGDGARFSRHGSIGGPRHFTFWREEPLTSALRAAGWRVESVERRDAPSGDQWLQVLSVRED